VSDSIRIGELARLCGVSDDTIRHYERKGVLTGVERDGSGLAAVKLGEVEERMAELLALRDALRTTIAQWDEELTATVPDEMAHLLERMNR
jgi:DNA-binding transcriptional MerR regulator